MHVYLRISAYIPQSESALSANYVHYVYTYTESDSGFMFALNVLAHGFKDKTEIDMQQKSRTKKLNNMSRE